MIAAPNSRFGLSGAAKISLPDPFAGPQCPIGYGRFQKQRTAPRERRKRLKCRRVRSGQAR